MKIFYTFCEDINFNYAFLSLLNEWVAYFQLFLVPSEHVMNPVAIARTQNSSNHMLSSPLEAVSVTINTDCRVGRHKTARVMFPTIQKPIEFPSAERFKSILYQIQKKNPFENNLLHNVHPRRYEFDLIITSELIEHRICTPVHSTPSTSVFVSDLINQNVSIAPGRTRHHTQVVKTIK